MHSLEKRNTARELFLLGKSKKAIAELLGVSRATVREWCAGDLPSDSPEFRTARCCRCTDPPAPPADEPSYAYLLGQYLGDGHVTVTERVPKLRIACAADYSDIMDEVERAMRAVLARSVFRVKAPGCYQVGSYSKHWPCLFPQVGRGTKHSRRIVLADWQEELVERHPRPLLRGLIHSDGSRSLNTIRTPTATYAYPRYLFANESVDILGICGAALDRIGARWRFNRRNSISVATRADVALLDEFIGPKT
jgi:hypothetical protein